MNVEGVLYGGIDAQLSITLLADFLNQLRGMSYGLGVGGVAGTGFESKSGQITFGSAGPVVTFGIPKLGFGVGISGY